MKKTLMLPMMMLTLASVAAPVLAHPGHAGDLAHEFAGAGFVAGMLHPLTGIDHLLALLAAGVWSGRQDRHGGALAAVFLAMMAAGAAAGMAGWRVPGLESGIALTVLVTGVLIAAAIRLPGWAGAALLATFATWHGNAHGLELPAVSSAAGYLATSSLLLVAGRRIAPLAAARPTGAAIAIAGLALLPL